VVIVINIWVGLQVLAELSARWLEKLYEKHLKKEEEKKYGRK
jgi:hypothetical protein